MNSKLWHRAPALITAILAGSTLLGAAETDEIANLKAALAAQQQQIQVLQDSINRLTGAAPAQPASLGNVASLTPVIPAPAPAPTAAFPAPRPQASADAGGNPCEAPPDATSVPPYLRIGSTCITPVGFLDMTGVWRNVNTGSGIGSNFASNPYNNSSPAGHLSEFRFSPQNSRIGFRIDGNWKGAHFMAYNENDFLGNAANGIAVTNGAFVPRIRLFFVDVTKDKWEFLAGQSWSLLTPNRVGISPLPGNLFYTQVTDVNYVVGLTWNRQPGFRFAYHPTKEVAFAVAVEQPDQYIGGNGGAASPTLPAATALSGIGGTQADNGTNTVNTPNLVPDIIAKLAFDPSSKFHFEVAGLDRTFKIYDSATNTTSTKAGGGLQFGANAEVMKGIRVMTSNFLADGGGRYLFGTGPDFIVRADGTISLIHAYGTVDGIEATVKNTLLYTYYGAAYYGRNTALDVNGTTLLGYGFKGSANTNNRDIQEITFGFNHTIWKNARYGAINYMMQYEYLLRDPWFVAVGAPKSAHDSTIYLNLRYTLPGAAPNFN